jgi:hypothetical protein
VSAFNVQDLSLIAAPQQLRSRGSKIAELETAA